MDEPRLSGQLPSILNMDTSGRPVLGGDGPVVTARTALVNDDGTWTGALRGYAYPHSSGGFRGAWLPAALTDVSTRSVGNYH